jgi:hypothetical protein
MNGDGARNGNDMQTFVGCFTIGGSCACADIDGLSGVGLDAIAPFVNVLLAGTSCP